MPDVGCEVLLQRCQRQLWAALLLCMGASAFDTAFAQAARDFSKVEVRTIKVVDNFHVLDFGGVGSTIGVLTGADGVLLIDTQFAPLGPKIEAAIRQLNPGPIRFVINTHAHGDHTGGNEYFTRLGATVVAHQNVRASMAQRRTANGPSVGVPALVYDSSMELYLNGEEVRLIAVPRAHTNGDTLVHLPGLDIIVVGDLFRPTPYPHIDLPAGGTVQGTLAGLDTLINLAGPSTKIIAGHAGPVADRATVIAQRDIIIKVRERVSALIAQGRNEEEIVAAKVTADLDPRVPQTDITVDRFVREVYADLKSATAGH